MGFPARRAPARALPGPRIRGLASLVGPRMLGWRGSPPLTTRPGSPGALPAYQTRRSTRACGSTLSQKKHSHTPRASLLLSTRFGPPSLRAPRPSLSHRTAAIQSAHCAGWGRRAVSTSSSGAQPAPWHGQRSALIIRGSRGPSSTPIPLPFWRISSISSPFFTAVCTTGRFFPGPTPPDGWCARCDLSVSAQHPAHAWRSSRKTTTTTWTWLPRPRRSRRCLRGSLVPSPSAHIAAPQRQRRLIPGPVTAPTWLSSRTARRGISVCAPLRTMRRRAGPSLLASFVRTRGAFGRSPTASGGHGHG